MHNIVQEEDIPQVDLIAYHGDTLYKELTVKQSDGSTSYDYTGHTARMQIRDKPEGGTLRATLTSSDGITLASGLVTISKDISPLLDVGEYYYDFEVTASSVKTKQFRGTIQIKERVTTESSS